MDKTLIKFCHCEKQIFCFFLPEACPVCDATLSGRRLEEAPVSVPSPFTNGHKTSCCFLITPGNSDFDETSELHTGISDTKGTHTLYKNFGQLGGTVIKVPVHHHGVSICIQSQMARVQGSLGGKPSGEGGTGICHGLAQEDTYVFPVGARSLLAGVVYNYTMSGVRRDVSGWERSISIPLVRPDMFNLLDQWNQYLEKFSDGPMWDPAWHRFDEKDHNCYSFTLEFVNGVLAMQGKAALSKDHFTEKFILPRMKRASKYNMLNQHIHAHSYYIIDRTTEDEGAQRT